MTRSRNLLLGLACGAIGLAAATALAAPSTAPGSTDETTAAAPLADPRDAAAERALQALAAEHKSVLVVTRARTGRLRPEAAAAATSPQAFSRALAETFAGPGGDLAHHSEPLALPAHGALATGFVATVEGFDGRCGFAVGGLDFTGQGGAGGLDASAALIFCVESRDAMLRATPRRIAERIAKVPPA